MGSAYESEYAKFYRINSTTLEEVCQKYTPGFSFFCTECAPEIFAGSTYPWHWHAYVQFFYVTEGRISYSTPGGTHYFEAGEGGFINANIPHMMSAKSAGRVRYREFLFYPSMIGGVVHGDIMKKYVQVITENAGFEVFRFSRSDPGYDNAIQILKEVYELFYEKTECYELIIQAKLSSLWSQLYLRGKEQRSRPTLKRSSNRLKTMLLFINENYAEKITLEKIARAGACSVRECSRTFRNDLHTTPFQYITEVRISKAANMLVDTNDPVTVISETCGFSDPSHFSKIFKAHSGMSPKEFRQRAHDVCGAESSPAREETAVPEEEAPFR